MTSEGGVAPSLASALQDARSRWRVSAPAQKKLGLVVGTFAAVPYVHLQLEAARRLYPGTPVLVHDDGSARGAELAALCERYGAEFVTNLERQVHHLGDLSVYPAALLWAKRTGVELLLKVSRRWIWREDWRPSLGALARESDAATFSNFTRTYAFGFRTECVAFDVSTWLTPELLGEVTLRLAEQQSCFVENYIHQWAIRFSEQGSAHWKRWAAEHPVPEERSGYAPWPFMGTCRHERIPSRLWHDSEGPEDYAALAAEWALSYEARDFFDPNMGEGSGPSAPDRSMAGAGLPELLAHLGEGLVGAEIGVWRGATSRRLLACRNVAKLYAVDPFRSYDDWWATIPQEELEQHLVEVQRAMGCDPRFELLRMGSDEAAARIEPPLDFVFIDGDHSGAQVQRDLENYWRKLRPGGLLSGHDYRTLGPVNETVPLPARWASLFRRRRMTRGISRRGDCDGRSATASHGAPRATSVADCGRSTASARIQLPRVQRTNPQVGRGAALRDGLACAPTCCRPRTFETGKAANALRDLRLISARMSRARFYLLLIAAAATAAVPCADAADFEKEIRPLLKEYCASCHNAEKQKGDFDLEPLLAKPDFIEQRETWEKAAELLASHEMPPEKKPQPSEEQRQMLVQFVERELEKADSAAPANPGKVTIRRLNRDEYRRTVSELLRVEFEPRDFPNDEVGYGFNNIADVLSLSPVLLEKYLAAAETIAKKALAADSVKTPKRTLRGDQFSSDGDGIGPREDKVLALNREGEAKASIELPGAGEYTLRVRAFGEQAGPDAPRLAVKLGGKEVAVFEVKNERPKTFEARVTTTGGAQPVSVAYLNNYNDTTNPDPKLRGDRNVFVESVAIEGPLGVASGLSDSQKQVLARLPTAGEELAVAHESLARFARRAYRRPVSEAETTRLVSFVELALANGGSFLEGMQAAVQAALCSPHFLFRWELDSETANPEGVRELNGFEVASRLSYFLWSSMPDGELFALAESGELLKNGNVEKQLKRMLADGRARALVENFGGQWLQVHNMDEVDPDPATFPNFSGELREDMRRETFAFLEAIMKEDRSVFELIDANFTFLNERLAKHYGIGGVSGGEFRKVALEPGSPRGGVLAQGSVLLATSMPTRTSPVIRGKWILEQILGTPPPPPPANVPPLEAQTGVDLNAPLRKRLEQHRENPDCAGCHAKMDPLGFALENFDALGAWRTTDGKNEIDTSAKLPNGTEISGPADLKKVLKTDKFVRALAEKMMIYALGRGLERYDKRAVEAIAAKAKAGDYRFAALVTAIATSDPFLKRKAEPKLASQ